MAAGASLLGKNTQGWVSITFGELSLINVVLVHVDRRAKQLVQHFVSEVQGKPHIKFKEFENDHIHGPIVADVFIVHFPTPLIAKVCIGFRRLTMWCTINAYIVFCPMKDLHYLLKGGEWSIE